MATQATAQPARIEHVDPKQLVIAANVRGDTKIEGDFVESIKQVGILQPPMVTENDTGSYDVVLGQRRTLGAIAAGLTVIPVYVVGKLEADSARIVDQLTENEQRQQLTDAERLGGYRQLSLFGMKPADMVKRTSRPKAEVDRYLKVLSSEAATQAVTDFPITLEDAAALAEFDKDPAAQKKVLKAAGTSQFKWEIQQARQKREISAKVDAVAKKLTKAGVTIVTSSPEYGHRLDRLAPADDPHIPFDEITHAACPGHVAYVSKDQWAAGQVTYSCADPDANGHVAKQWGTPDTPEQIAADEARRAAEAAAEADEQAAFAIRRAFIVDQLTGKQPADLALVFAKAALLLEVSIDVGTIEALALLDLPIEPEPDPDEVYAAMVKNPKLAAAYPAAVALAELDDTIRYLSPVGYQREQLDFAAREYFAILQAWGYELTDYDKGLLEAREKAAAAAALAKEEAADPKSADLDDAPDGDEDDFDDENDD